MLPSPILKMLFNVELDVELMADGIVATADEVATAPAPAPAADDDAVAAKAADELAT